MIPRRVFPKLKKLLPQLQMGHGSDYTKYDNLILVNKLSLEQRRVFAGFWAQLAVAWLVAGLIGPYFADIQSYSAPKLMLVVFWTGTSIAFMLHLTRGGKK